MKFTGQVALPDIDHPAVPATFLIEGDQAEIVLDAGPLGRWSLVDVCARRVVSQTFQVELAGEKVVFIAAEPVAFAYDGLGHMAEVSARHKAKGAVGRALAAKKSRRGVKPSRIGELREAMLRNVVARPTAPRLKLIGASEPLPVSEPLPASEPTPAELGPGAGAVDPAARPEETFDEGRRVVEAERARLEEARRVLEAQSAEAERRDADRVEAFRLEMERLEAERERVARAAEVEPPAADEGAEPIAAEGGARETEAEAAAGESEPELAEELIATSGDDESVSKQLVVDLGRFEETEAAPETPPQAEAPVEAPTADAASAPGPAAETASAVAVKPGIMGAVKGAFSRGKNHEHEFVQAPGGVGIVRLICRECGFVSISAG